MTKGGVAECNFDRHDKRRCCRRYPGESVGKSVEEALSEMMKKALLRCNRND